MKATSIRLLLLLIAVVSPAFAVFYIPGVLPQDFAAGDEVPLWVNKITSVRTQLPFAYYSLPVCKPQRDILKKEDVQENIGEILRGDKIEPSLYELYALEPKSCDTINLSEEKEVPSDVPADQKNLVCTKYNKEQLETLSQKVKEEYSVQWIVDNLPAAHVGADDSYTIGFPLGFVDEEGDQKPYIYNHVKINILYTKSPSNDSLIRIVGFEIEPDSKAYNVESWLSDANRAACPPESNVNGYQTVDPEAADTYIAWTYEVAWTYRDDIKWTHRWDRYLRNTDKQIHWFSIINSLMIVLFLTGMVAAILMRALRADLRKYNQLEHSEEIEETGWKLVHGDVFRPPQRPMLLSVLIGSGVQVAGMTIVTMLFAVLGFLSPANRGMLVTSVIVLFVIMGIFAGYFSTRCYKTFKGTHWKKNTLMTAVFFPGVIFVIFFILNLCEYGQKSSGAVPASVVASLCALWIGISVPLVFFGSYFGYKKPLDDDPVRTNQIPRQIPQQVWYMSPVLSTLMGGILPFGAVFIELYFILSAIWIGTHFYYIFGFLFIVLIILILTCAEITIVMCYFQLCAEDYNWWWRSFLTAGASALYMFLYSIFYFFNRLTVQKFVTGVIYFGYTLIMSFTFFVFTGTIGFYACYFFVRKIYGSIKVD